MVLRRRHDAKPAGDLFDEQAPTRLRLVALAQSRQGGGEILGRGVFEEGAQALDRHRLGGGEEHRLQGGFEIGSTVHASTLSRSSAVRSSVVR